MKALEGWRGARLWAPGLVLWCRPGSRGAPTPCGSVRGTCPALCPSGCSAPPASCSPPLPPTRRGPRCVRAGRTAGTPHACSALSPTAGCCLWGCSCWSKREAKQVTVSPRGSDGFLCSVSVVNYQQALSIEWNRKKKKKDLLIISFLCPCLVMLLKLSI